MRNMRDKLYKHICKHYASYSLTANCLNAIAMAGLALLGILTNAMALTWLIGWGITFAIMLGVGSLLNQEIDDLDKVRSHNCDESLRKTEK